MKKEVLERLWTIESALQEPTPNTRDLIGDTIAWLRGDKDSRMVDPIRELLGDARGELDNQRYRAAIRSVQRAISEVRAWPDPPTS